MPNYRVTPPNEPFENKRYVEWVQDWSNWFYQINPDHNNNGDVVFLRSMPLAEGKYLDEGVVMVGNDSLEISADQRVLIPIITANYVADHSETSEWLYGMVRSHIAGGDHHPLKEQLRIDGQPIDDGNKDEDDLRRYEIETPIFMIGIPDISDSSYEKSLKDQMEIPMQSPGFFPSVTRGYFVMLELNAGKDYYIECYATGLTTAFEQYHASLLYHIVVNESRKQKQLTVPPSRLSNNLISKVRDKHHKGEFDKNEFEKIKGYLEMSKEKIGMGMLGNSQKKGN